MKKTFRNLKKVYSFSEKYRSYLFRYFLGSILICSIGIIIPILNAKQIVGITGNLYSQAILATVSIFVIEIFHSLVNFITRIYTQKFFCETITTIQTKLGKAILEVEVPVIDKHTTGVFTQRIGNDTSALASVFTSGGIYLTNIVTDVGVFLAILIISPLVFGYYLLTFGLLLYLHRRRIKTVNKKDKIYRQQREKTAGLVTELVRGIRDIKMLNAENSFMDEVTNDIQKLNKKNYDMVSTERKYQLIINVTKDLNNLCLALLVIYLIVHQNLLLSLGIVVFSYRSHVINLVSTMGIFLDYLRDFNLSCDRVFALFDDKEFSKEKFGTKHIEKIKGNFAFKNVSFGYDNEKKVLNNISFEVKQHETVAFVGKSGVGKTTIFNLLCKMYPVQDGIITIDGVNINELDKDSIRGNITIISQNPYIFNMSIKDNLRLVKSDLTDEEMYKACEMACLTDFINKLPQKYDTIVGEGGVNLSGGQRQRLAIARALVQKTKIILFDEATSSLDNETQSNIQKAINNMKDEYTILIIAHRLSTVINSDHILVIDNGTVLATGTHETLLKNCKEYQHLYESEMINELE